MIYPDFRISDLEREVAIRRERLLLSKDQTLFELKQKIHPLEILKKHKLSALMGLVSIYPVAKLVGLMGRALLPKGKFFASLFTAGTLVKLLEMGWDVYSSFRGKGKGLSS